jgi:hypothetical protein
MTEQTKGFTDLVKDPAADAVALLTHYSFDLRQHTATALVDEWLTEYKPSWIRHAVIEALYQGRYKAISVEQILALWQRRGQTLHHFNHEFERLVCNKLPRSLTQPAGTDTEDPHSAAIATFLKRLHQDINYSPTTDGTEDSLIASPSLPQIETHPPTPANTLESDSLSKTVSTHTSDDPAVDPQPFSSVPAQSGEDTAPFAEMTALEEADALTTGTYRSPTLFPTGSEAAEIVVDDTPAPTPSPEHASVTAFVPETSPDKEHPVNTELEGNNPDASPEVVASSTNIADFAATESSQHNSLEATAFASVFESDQPNEDDRQPQLDSEGWLEPSAKKQSINQFTPISDESSEFHAKLRAVAHVDEPGS